MDPMAWRLFLNLLGGQENMLALRKSLMLDGRPFAPIRVMPSDLEQFGLLPWEGSVFGMVCVSSPLVVP